MVWRLDTQYYTKLRLAARSSAMQNSSLEVCLIGLAPGENAIARKSRLGLYAQQKKIARVERTLCLVKVQSASQSLTGLS